MAILEKEVLVTLNGANLKHFEELGYIIPRVKTKWGKISIPQGTKILVKVDHLTKASRTKVTKVCDICGIYIPNKKYVDIINKRLSGDGKDRCHKCANRKGVMTKRKNMPYERTLKYYAISNNKEYLLDEFSNKNDIKPIGIPSQSWEKLLWNCPKCGSEYSMAVSNRTVGECGCPFCTGQQVNHTNCMWTTNPEIAKLLTDSKMGYEVTINTNQKLNFTCPECGNIDKKYPRNVLRVGFGCSKCSDGFSFPEKIIINMLSQLEIDFKTQKTFKWSLNKRYDFYISSLNCIIETHGMQHYEEGTFDHLGGRNLKEEQENDLLKEKLARDNGIQNYIIIDCRKSNMEFIRENVTKSKLSKLINLTIIDWLKCNEFACNSLVKKVCDLYEKEPMSTVELAKLVGLERSTICRYLKLGKKNGWCSYDGKEVQRQLGKVNGGHNAIKIVQLSLDGEFIKEWDSAQEIESELKIHHTAIPNVCKGKLNQSGGFRFMYKEDYDKNGVVPSKDTRPKIIQLSLDDEFIKEYRNANEGTKSLGKLKSSVASIHKCCKGERKTAFGFKWMHKEDYEQISKTL